ncbi:hypothetical protein Focb16_v006016 [Fusarium oxysporum f. sp. cubense]|uniref:Uncharacterized protein n=1 Tax=Fusarium oxysporum f. sp. cubense TaxID=61366 RepID=A0A559LHP0_FUSOC|nr:hypothetical protein Focb16_v006016 [Fusarium oxysporum f. sp. cubense]
MHLSSITRLAMHGSRALSSQSSLCFNGPSIPLEAGVSVLSAMIDLPLEGRCEATMQFADSAFLPIRFSFDKVKCEGQQINKLRVPRGVSNGEAEVIWQCAGLAPSYSRAVISGGDADMSSPALYTGIVGCVSEMLQTRTTTPTITHSTATIVETFPTIFTTFITTYLSQASSGKTTPVSPTDGESGTQAIGTSYAKTEVKGETSPPDSTTTGASEAGATTAEISAVDAATTDAGVIGAATSTVTTTGKAASKDDTRPESPGPKTTDDKGVFLSNAPRTTAPLATILTLSLMTTLTVTRTVTAECTSV